ncbi:MAG: stage III sporulation protein AF [Oscillospiraceae bacterium]|nr:stage III sporulation protein AF [Oscillospiraceae bacterium]
MNGLREWLLGVVAAALAVSLAQSLTPDGTVKRVGRLVGGLVLLLAVVRPLGALIPRAASLPVMAYGTMTEEEAGQGGEEVIKTLIAEKTGAYIVDKGQALGLSCQARVRVTTDESGWPVPWEAEIWGQWTPEGKKKLSRAVEEDLGIPAQRQSFWEEGT